MKNLFNIAAGGIFGAVLLFHPGFAREAEAQYRYQPRYPYQPVPQQRVVQPQPLPQVTETRMPGVLQGVVLYANVLEKAKNAHVNGPTTVKPEDIAQAALQAVLQRVYNEKFSGQTDGVTFAGGEGGKKVQSLTINGQVVAAVPPQGPLPQHRDQANYLAGPIQTLSRGTGISVQDLFEDAINGALKKAYDPHTNYFDKEGADRFMGSAMMGEMCGVGMMLEQKGDYIFVKSVIGGAPAERAGVKAGDIIAAINGVPAKGMTTSDASSKVAGPAGTSVTLSFRRGQSEFQTTIQRAKFALDAVEGQLVGGDASIAHLHIDGFTRQVPNDFCRTLQDLKNTAAAAGKPMTAVILDLRDNGGGDTLVAHILCDYFLENAPDQKGSIVVYGERDRQEHAYIDSFENVGGFSTLDLSDTQVVILQNQGSASASEVTTGALMDRGVKVVGTPSYGKGSRQSIFHLDKDGNTVPGGSAQQDGMVKVTSAVFYSGGEMLTNQKYRITPHVLVVYNDVRDELVESDFRESKYENCLTPKGKTREGETPEKICALRPEYAGPLSPEIIATLPSELVRSLTYYDEERKAWQSGNFFDADMDAAIQVLTGSPSPYTVMTDYVPPTPAPSNDNRPESGAVPPAPLLALPAPAP